MTIVNVVNADGHSQIHPVIDIATQVDVILTDISLLSTVHRVVVGSIGIPYIIYLIVIQVARIEIVELTALALRTVEIRSQGLAVDLIEQSVLGLHIRLLVL